MKPSLFSRRGSETSEVLRELLNAGIDRNAKVVRCGGERRDQIQEFKVYSPKVIALIGELDGVLADRCLPIFMKWKTQSDPVEPYRSRIVEPKGKLISEELEQWATNNADRVADVYDHMETFAIENDRMAELLLPLQAVLKVVDAGRLPELEQYAKALDECDAQSERETPGVQLLLACREIFAVKFAKAKKGGTRFLATTELIEKLVQRDQERWAHWPRGRQISPEAIANLLRPYGVRSGATLTNRRVATSSLTSTRRGHVTLVPSKNPG